MIIIPNRAGQLGNQLFEIAHFAASSIEHGFKVSYLAFGHPLGYFPAINSLPNVRIHVASAERGLCYHRVARGLRMVLPSSSFHASLKSPGPPHVDIGSPDFVRKALYKVVICQGFGFRDIANVAKHHDKLTRMFRMSDCVLHEVDDFYRKMVVPSHSVVVGFHVRRGDYRSFKGGHFHFSDSQWTLWINACRSLITRQGLRFLGVIFSNEDVSDLTRGANDLVPSPGGLFTDLEMLTRCNYIVGPPSTYSGWASFIARVPSLRLDARMGEITLERFEVVLW
jgi:hypothetical protein